MGCFGNSIDRKLLRELVAKLRSMTETIKMLSTENVALREENDGLVMMRGSTSGIQDPNLPRMSLLKSCVGFAYMPFTISL